MIFNKKKTDNIINFNKMKILNIIYKYQPKKKFSNLNIYFNSGFNINEKNIYKYNKICLYFKSEI